MLEREAITSEGYCSIARELIDFNCLETVPTITVSFPTSTWSVESPLFPNIPDNVDNIINTDDAGFRLVQLPLKSWLIEKKKADLVNAKERVESVWEILPHLEPIIKYDHILSDDECDWLVKEAEAGANRRGGWLGDRHRGYATTDIRVNHVSQEVTYISIYIYSYTLGKIVYLCVSILIYLHVIVLG